MPALITTLSLGAAIVLAALTLARIILRKRVPEATLLLADGGEHSTSAGLK